MITVPTKWLFLKVNQLYLNVQDIPYTAPPQKLIGADDSAKSLSSKGRDCFQFKVVLLGCKIYVSNIPDLRFPGADDYCVNDIVFWDITVPLILRIITLYAS